MKLKWKIAIVILLAILSFIIADNILENKEKELVLEGRIFFDSNDDLRIDENDTLLTAPLKLKIIPYVPPENKTGGFYVLSKSISYDITSKEGYYKLGTGKRLGAWVGIILSNKTHPVIDFGKIASG